MQWYDNSLQLKSIAMLIGLIFVTVSSIQYAEAAQLRFDQPTIIFNHGDIITYIGNVGEPAPIITLSNSANGNTMDLQLINVQGTNIFRTMVKFTSDSQNDLGTPSYGLGTTSPVQVTAQVTTPTNGPQATSTVKADTSTIQFNNRRSDNTFATCTADVDGDGICDNWENNNILTINYPSGTSSYTFQCGTSSINPPCDNTKRDIFVEIDSMVGHKPNLEAIQSVVNAFASAPDPDGTGPLTSGIRLHVQMADETSPPISHTDNTLFPGLNLTGKKGFDQIKATYFGTPDERSNSSWWSTTGWKQKKQAFHYVLFVHSQGTSSSGISEILGNDVMISLGSFDYQIGNPDQQAGTLMHELGHNLNLNHGGASTDVVNCKPNYLSVMSYSRQFSDLVSDRTLDFSHGQLNQLSENQLNENDGVLPTQNPNQRIVFGPVPPAILPQTGSPVDWNQNGIIDGLLSQTLDINSLITNSGIIICSTNTDTQYSGYDDWSSIVLDSKGTGNWADGRSITSPIDTESPICPPISSLIPGTSTKLNRVCGGGFGNTDHVIPTQYEKPEIKPVEKLATTEVTISPAPGSSSPGCETSADGCFIPKGATVDVGGSVIFSNTDTAAHTFTAGSAADGPSGAFDSSLVVAGSSYEWKPTTVGSFPFYCMVHPWMAGLVVVEEIAVVEPSPVKSVEEPKVITDKTESSGTLTPVNDTEFVNTSYKNSEITSDTVKSMRILRIDSLENYVNMHSESIKNDSKMKILGKYGEARVQINKEKYADVIHTLNSIDYTKLVSDPTIAKELRSATDDVQISIGQAVAEPISIDSDHDGVVNTLDNCPNTPEHTKVDAKGCPETSLFWIIPILVGVAYTIIRIIRSPQPKRSYR